MSEKVLSLMSHIMTALSACSLYSDEHPAVYSLSEKAVEVLEGLYEEDCFSLAVLGQSLIINGAPFRLKSNHVSGFMKRLLRKGIEKVVITKGVTAEELKSFISDLASREKIRSSGHISSGIVEVRTGGGATDCSSVMEDGREQVKEIYRGVSKFKTLDMGGLESVVISFISTLKQETNVLRVVSPVKSHSEYTFTHTTNVAVLSLYQAESLGLRGEILHDVCLAGLLHDLGKLFVSNAILDKKGKLDEAEWDEMKKHPVYGALHLSKMPEVPELAVIAAYEHHMKYDGTGYPDTGKRVKRQHIISQVVAISDFFDALRTERSYRKALEVPVILGLIKEASGRDFNPFLADNFLCVMGKMHEAGR